MIILCLFFILCQADSKLQTITSDEYTVTFTTAFDFGSWQLTVTKINGTQAVRFCTGTQINPNTVSVPGQFSTISSAIWKTPSCYKKDVTITMTILGASVNDSVSVNFTETEIPLTALDFGSAFTVLNVNTTRSYYKFVVSGAPHMVQLFIYPDPNVSVANTYTATVQYPNCVVNNRDVVVRNTALAQSTEVQLLRLCNPVAGTYIVYLEAANNVAIMQNITLKLGLYDTVSYTDVTSNTNLTLKYYETAFYRYTPSGSASAISTYTLTFSAETLFGVVNGRASDGDEPLCPSKTTQSRSLNVNAFQPVQNISVDFPECNSVSYFYIAFTPIQPVNRSDTKTGNLTLKIMETNPPAATSIALGTEYNITRLNYWVLPDGSIPGGSFAVVNITGTANDNIAVSLRRGNPVLFDGTCGDTNLAKNLNCQTAQCNYSFAFPTCAYGAGSGDYYFTVDNIQNSKGLKFQVNTITTSSADSTLLQDNQTISGVVSRVGNTWLKYDSIPPSILKITNLGRVGGGGGNAGIDVNVQQSGSSACLSSDKRIDAPGGGILSSNFMSLLLICPTSGMILLSGRNDISYTAIRNSLSSVSFNGTTLQQNSISTVASATNIFATFSVSSSSVLTFTVSTTEPQISLWFRAYPKNSCSSVIDYTCYLGNYPCTFQTQNPLDAQDYNLVITDGLSVLPATTPYNLTVSFVYGNTLCRNITNELKFCAGHLDLNKYYNTQFTSVANYETDASNVYDDLIGTWSMACNMTIRDYACKSVFQQALCTDSGDNNEVFLCKNDCVNTLQSACLTDGGSANLCESTACSTAASRVSQCNRPPTPTPDQSSSGSTLHFMVLVSLLSLMLHF